MALILIIDEDLETLTTLETNLSSTYTIRRATDGIEAITELRRQTPDLILMALGSSGIDGMGLTQRLRESQHYQAIPIILIVDDQNDTSIELANAHGINDHVTKPIDFDTLLTKIQYHLDKAERKNQRRTKRYIIRWRVDYQCLQSDKLLNPSRGHKTLIVNISAGGAAFISLSEIHVGDICAFATYHPEQDSPSLAVGQIVWVKPISHRQIAGAKWLGWKSKEEKALIIKAASAERNLDFGRKDSDIDPHNIVDI